VHDEAAVWAEVTEVLQGFDEVALFLDMVQGRDGYHATGAPAS
jgi:hypothetical protein